MPVPAFPDDVEPTVPLVFEDDLEPSVLLVFEDVPLELVAFVWFLSRTILLLSSQHRLEAVPLDPELVPVPCAFAMETGNKGLTKLSSWPSGSIR